MRRTLSAAFAIIALGACARADNAATDSAKDTGVAAAPADTAAASAQGATVQVAMRDASARELGNLTVSESANGLTLTGTLRGLPPGTHGIHFHMTGSCEPPFESAGGHWNPTSTHHGLENPQGPHLGDLQNIQVGADSSVTVNTSTRGGTLRGQNALLDADGAAVIIHAGADDNKNDPSGNSGARMACGIVR